MGNNINISTTTNSINNSIARPTSPQVITWGVGWEYDSDIDSSEVELRQVLQVQATDGAFVAVTQNGEAWAALVVTRRFSCEVMETLVHGMALLI